MIGFVLHRVKEGRAPHEGGEYYCREDIILAMELPRLVMKFGGTSLADADRIREAGAIVLAHRKRRPAVVVSAAAGVTATASTCPP